MLGRVLHLVRFDLRSVAPIVAIWFGALLLESFVLWMGPPVPDPSVRQSVSLDLAAIVVRFAITVVMVATLVHRHPLVGTTAFWRTRPVPRIELLTAQVSTIALLAVAVPVTWFAATFLALGLDVSSALRGAAFVGVEQAFAAALVSALASLAVNLAQVVVGGVAILVLFYQARVQFAGSSPRHALPFAITVHDSAFAGIIWLVTAACALAIVAVHQHVTLRRWRSLALLVAAFVGYQLLFKYPPLRLVPDEPVTASAEVAREAPQLAFEPDSMRSEHQAASRGPGGMAGQGSMAYAAWLPGPPGTIILAPRGTRTTLTFADGSTSVYAPPGWPRMRPSAHIPATPGQQPYSSLTAAVGAKLLVDPRDVTGLAYRIVYLEVPDATFKAKRSTPATLEAALATEAYRYVVSARMPLVPGTRSTGAGRRYVLVARDRSDSGMTFDVAFPSCPDQDAIAPVMFLVRNQARGEAILLAQGGQASIGTTWLLGDGLKFTRLRLEAILAERPALQGIDEAWFADAELVVASPEPLGAVNRTIRISPFLLDPRSGLSPDPAGALTVPRDGQ